VSEKDEAAPEAAGDVPETRKHGALPEKDGDPPVRESHVSLDSIPVGYPDDGAVSSNLRRVDHYVGMIEQGLLFVVLAAVVVVAASAALSDRVFGHQLGRWWHYIVRGGTFSIAMFAAAFASHQQRHLAMDLNSRRLTPRGRLVLGLLLNMFTIAIAAVLMHTGWHLRETASGADREHLELFGLNITDKTIVASISVGAALIIFHSILHAVIDIEYLVRRKLPPERARSGH
jgi:TRAP-type C4-dicarboxylate transport system permease small subunit